MIITIVITSLVSWLIVVILMNSYIDSLQKEIKSLKAKLEECNDQRYFGKQRK